MSKLFLNALKMSPVALAATFSVANSAIAGEVTSVSQLTQESSQEMGQVTSVSQFSDVQPTDWAFQALQSLVERYGCIAGYPNGTYRGNRALTRYEFAAGLNACLDRVNELIATATADLVTKEDLATLQRLQEEFSAELATLRGRVDSLEARTAELEANQFSTTTKLKGEAIFALSSAFGDQAADTDNDDDNNPDLQDNVTFSNRLRLRLLTSFTGTDQLETRLNAANITQFRGGVTGTNMTRLGFDSNNGNNVELDKLNYAFNATDAVRVKVEAIGARVSNNINVFNPLFKSSSSGAISRFGRFSSIYRANSGSDSSGLTVSFNPKGRFSFDAAYVVPNASDPSDGNGAFNGSNTALAQLSFKPSKQIGLGLVYSRVFQTGSDVNLTGSIGSGFAADPFGDVATTSNNYGVQASFQPSDQIVISGWAGLTNATAESGANEGADADIFYWSANVGIKDFGAEGNVLGLIVGQSPKVTDSDIAAREDSDTSFHLEGLYKMKLTDNIAVTPGLMVIFNPEHNNDNDTIYVGTIRTTFKF
ncbi:iron uptake porin [Calothrix rhizosoleniae]|uniref:iron uptake porin n=1 Tax=Calothrix rhizosoleniae TaxID=888997 RepID=UPI000B4A368C|nr:iron uptake porin [Calothrix rhizosoleniae]